jgi:hypothetical protein
VKFFSRLETKRGLILSSVFRFHLVLCALETGNIARIGGNPNFRPFCMGITGPLNSRLEIVQMIQAGLRLHLARAYIESFYATLVHCFFFGKTGVKVPRYNDLGKWCLVHRLGPACPPFHNLSLFSKLKQLASKAYIMEQRK